MILRKIRFDFGDMVLALVLWMYSLPLVAMLVLPYFGLKIGLMVAVVLFFIAMTVCWGVCGWKIYKTGL